MTARPRPAWPAHLRPGAVRFGRESVNYEATVAFYRDLVGLPVVGVFAGSFGEDGTIFGLPDTTLQLEIIRAHHPSVSAFDQVVFYLDNVDALAAATAPLRASGLTPTTDQHPYWAANNAVTFRDPDGRDVVFAPWVYGRDPEPTDAGDDPTAVRIEWFDGDRETLRKLFAQAEDSRTQLDAYLHAGRVLIARYGDDIVGHLQLIAADDGVDELKNMAVAAAWRGRGIGAALVEHALNASRLDGATRMIVATGAADVGNLRFYQRCGFRFFAVERDAFTPDTGYSAAIDVDGIPLRDRVWLDQTIAPPVSA